MYIDKLLSIAGNELSNALAIIPECFRDGHGVAFEQLVALLNCKNGFFAFESALRIFPVDTTELSIGMVDWNSKGLWINSYYGLADNCIFFAEDIFGGQFCIKDNAVFSFDPEIGDLAYVADDIEGWAGELLEEYEVMTGYPLAHDWQKRNGPLPNSDRLMPKTPFVCGGEFSIDNLCKVNAISGMKTRANLARQIHDLEDGAQIEFRIIE
ncbi:SMI1/KNR4 family protein [Hahella sp. HN01]|uniref:SMI1/KNR4 family protein n=1 Tax=Hahella sp. HN01 TaxID=2847262 RepID=UPI001C1EA525|nr:SMI1/KNR4 family protein [Hahella sp. HN01]MBU6951604.1 SMI1/KNR4 family protein [Hahella sp. HN01]